MQSCRPRSPGRLVLRVALGLVLSGVWACKGGDDGASGESSGSGTEGLAAEFGSLIDHDAWTVLDAADDPLADHRPLEIDCGIGGWYIEDEGPRLEVDTNQCNYLALRQPSLRPIAVGDTLRVSFYHFDLVAPEPAEGHLYLSVDGQVVWDYLVPIPSNLDLNKTPAAVIDETLVAEFSAPLGSEVILHVHNHGQNTWNFVDLALVE